MKERQKLSIISVSQKSAHKDLWVIKKRREEPSGTKSHLAYLHPTLLTIKYNFTTFPPTAIDMAFPPFEIPKGFSVHGPQRSTLPGNELGMSTAEPHPELLNHKLWGGSKNPGCNKLWGAFKPEALWSIASNKSWMCETEAQEERLEVITEESSAFVTRAQLRSPEETLERGEKDYRTQTMQHNNPKRLGTGRITRKIRMLPKQGKLLSRTTMASQWPNQSTINFESLPYLPFLQYSIFLF